MDKMASPTLNIIDSSATVFTDLINLDSVSFNNKTKSITWDLSDPLINTRLLIDRIYVNNFDCYVNTKRGNFILDSFENWLHMVFYEKRWNCINRVNALPFTPNSINRQDISLNFVQDQAFGSNILITPVVSTNNGANNKFYISNKVIVSAPRFISTQTGSKGVGALYVYDYSTMNIEDMITIPYYYYLGVNQGNFGTHTAILSMKNFGYDYLIVSAPSRRKLTTETLLSIFIFTYSKKTDGSSFYFHNETFGDKEIIVNTTKTLRDIKTIDSTGFLLIFDDEIIRYNILNQSSQSVIVSSGIKISAGSLISNSSLTIRSIDTVSNLAYILYSNNIIHRFNTTSDLNTLINLGPAVSYTTRTLNRIKVSKVNNSADDKIVAQSASGILYFTVNNNTPYLTNDVSSNILTFDVNNANTVIIDQNNISFYVHASGVVLRVSRSTTFASDTFSSNKILMGSDSKMITGGFASSKVYMHSYITSNISLLNTITLIENQPEILMFSEDSEILYAMNPTTKIISQFNRNANNDYEFVQTILPSESMKRFLGYRDTIYDTKLDVANVSLFIGFLPFGANQVGSVIGVNINRLLIEVRFSGTTPSFGKSIDLSKTGRYLLVGEPEVPIETVNAITYKRGAVHLYDAINPSNLRFNVLRSSQYPIGNLVKFSPSENEFLSIGSKTVVEPTQLVCFTNIFEKIYRSCVFKYEVTDAIYLYDGDLVLSGNELVNGKQIYHKNQKVNNCFEINTQKDITIPDITNTTSLKLYPLGLRYAFFHSSNGTVTLMDITSMKKIYQFTANINTNITCAINGTGFAHGFKSNGVLLLSFYA